MALVNQDNVVGQFVGMSRLPVVRQVGLLLGLAVSIALGVGIYTWAKEPNYVPLFNGLTGADAAQVVTVLEQSNTPYRLQGSMVVVPASKVHNLRIQFASQGLPKSSVMGFEILNQEQSFGTSSFIERARFNLALEGELSKSIATLNSVQGARVHLAIPKKSAFLRNQVGASASVLVSLYPGQKLSQSQIAGVIHLVASSVPGMDASAVTVVDQQGNLLTGNGSSSSLALGSEQFSFASSIEENYSQRIVDLLVPVIGAGKVRAQVTADVDFTVIERTSETFGPDNTMLRSEQTSEERSSDNSKAFGGVPGALANQPEALSGVPGDEASTNSSAATQTMRQATRNYELDKVISHIKEAPGTIKKLSVAVLLDYREQTNEAGDTERVPLADEEIERMTQLVKEAVGFNEERGDSVQLMNTSFLEPELMEPLPETPVWKEPWVLDIAKQTVGALGLILLVFGVLRPVMKSLAGIGKQGGGQALSGELQLGADQVNLSGGLALPPGVTSYDQQVTLAQSIAGQSPKRAARVMSDWVQDGG